ncbi:hypothetical protein NUH88_15870 [Nisaea acidiphila]|uniref:Uncharacterized protein n=1 Tax=Nisaea acidiphila TaxID=1862145 RepID=A0A9J7AN50_9PROT|nr:hypothetical protein [Nisaea acidiphila]UUX48872.1 hypothetical protein NUH88_15870 [Nisaea acidiphila]
MRRTRPTSINFSAGLLKQLDRQVKIEGARSRSMLMQQFVVEGLQCRGHRDLGFEQSLSLPLQGELGGALAILKAGQLLGSAIDLPEPARKAVEELVEAANRAVLAISEGGLGRNNGVSLRSIAPAPEHAYGVRKHDYHR